MRGESGSRVAQRELFWVTAVRLLAKSARSRVQHDQLHSFFGQLPLEQSPRDNAQGLTALLVGSSQSPRVPTEYVST